MSKNKSMFPTRVEEERAFQELMTLAKAWQPREAQQGDTGVTGQLQQSGASTRQSDGWGTEHPDDAFGPDLRMPD